MGVRNVGYGLSSEWTLSLLQVLVEGMVGQESLPVPILWIPVGVKYHE
jgi:hypothetical protein